MALTSINLQTEDIIDRCAYLLCDSPTNDKYREYRNRMNQLLSSTVIFNLHQVDLVVLVVFSD